MRADNSNSKNSMCGTFATATSRIAAIQILEKSEGTEIDRSFRADVDAFSPEELSRNMFAWMYPISGIDDIPPEQEHLYFMLRHLEERGVLEPGMLEPEMYEQLIEQLDAIRRALVPVPREAPETGASTADRQ